MNWFKVFSRTKIDEEILELYLEIEILISDIDEILTDYLKYIFDSDYYKNNHKNKKIYSIRKINYFFKKLKADYAYCYTLRKDKKYYQFHKNAKSRAEKIEIEITLKKILKITKEIYSYCKQLNKSKIKENDFSQFIKDFENYLKKLDKKEHIFEYIKSKDEHIIFEIIGKIKKEAYANIKRGVYLISQYDQKTKLPFSQDLSIREIKYLDLIPLLELEKLKKRSLFINELHKDSTLPVFHYNLEIDGKNIHVIPRNYKAKIKPFLHVA